MSTDDRTHPVELATKAEMLKFIRRERTIGEIAEQFGMTKRRATSYLNDLAKINMAKRDVIHTVRTWKAVQ